MEERKANASVAEPIQFSLGTLVAVFLTAALWLAIAVAFPMAVAPLTVFGLAIGLPVVCFVYRKPFWGFLLLAFFVLILPIFGAVQTLAIPYFAGQQSASRDKRILNSLSTALEQFHKDHGYYPAVGNFKHSSAALYAALTGASGGTNHSYVLALPTKELDGETLFVSIARTPIYYQPTTLAGGKRGFTILTLGRDGVLGGNLDAEKGFVPDNSDANGDGNPDHLDNVISEVR